MVRREEGLDVLWDTKLLEQRWLKKYVLTCASPNDLTQKIVIMIRWHMFFSDPDQITLSAVRRVIAAVGKENIWDLLNVRVCDRIGTGRPKAHPFRLRKYITMVEQALRDPISVGQLVLDGKGIMEHTGEKPGPRIGHMLHALLEDVLTDPTQNTVEKLVHRARELSGLNSDELKLLGESGRVLKDEREAAAIKDIDRKYHVS
jgi:tRNA nucleotidyltransferase (CCA-adding enzyme)